MLFALEVSFALWAMVVCLAMEAAQFFQPLL
jgi:hypothetical protein